MREILVLCPDRLDGGLLSWAAEHGPVRAVVGPGMDAARYGAEKVHILEEFPADEGLLADFLAEKIRQWDCKIVLSSGTVRMRSLMPMLAWKLEAGLTADCTGLRLDGENLIQIRPAFGNSLMAVIATDSQVQMATVRPMTFPLIERPVEHPEIIRERCPGVGRVQRLGFSAFPEGRPLQEAEILVAGGLGIGSKAGFEKLAAFAERIDAGLGASRGAVDAGFAPYRCQIGFTGQTVRPRLYIAVGISGAVQHLSGMLGSEKIIAINADPKAPIFDYADLGLVGDWAHYIDAFRKENFE